MFRFLLNTVVGVVLLSTSAFSFADPNLHHANKVVDRAHELIGTPYKWGGNTITKGFDCSGLLVYLFRSEAGIRLPRDTTSIFTGAGVSVTRNKLKRGDIVFFKISGRRKVSHVGIYIGKNQFIHAPSYGKYTRVDSLNNSYWHKRYVAAKRLL